QALRAMCAAIRHRGPDDDGYFVQGGVGLGMRRLSIIDVAGGHQPIFNEDRSCVIVYNGEIYNHRDVRRELEKRGHRYGTHSDTETILHAYEEYGVDCVKHLRGMFAIAIWDEPRRRLFLARDRFGKKPLYYAHVGGRVVFGSELKAIVALPEVARRVNSQAVADYIAWGYVPDPLTIYQGIAKLPPAHWLTYEAGRVRVERYWDVSYAPVSARQPEEFYVGRTLEILDEAVRIRLMSEVPLGAFLSGGTDSSIVVGLMARHSSERVKTFSIGFEESAYNELPYARKVAGHFGTEHHEEIVRPDAERDVLSLVRQFDEPFADSSMLPTYYVSRAARKFVTVALSGDGGDELFAGYLRYVDDAWVRAASRLPAGVRDAVLGPLARALPAGTKGIDRLRDLLGTPDDFYVRQMTRGIAHSARDVFADEFVRQLEHRDPAHVATPFLHAARGWDALSRRQYLDTNTYLPGDILTKVDRASMIVSLECRAPILDHELAEFAATIPVDLRIKGLTTKYLLKKVAERLMPAELVHRPKMGFAIPVAYWLKGEWAARSEDLLLGKASLDRGVFREAFLRRVLSEHRSGKRDNSSMIWSLMMLELWWRNTDA
ncbi:MAG TPA: asparagine synthase (glutamine-hydrolyzing), partial [Candidatus Krumholzibacteria bacterium]|nr:asparagine synthase (glutamine-hydrolyzing) [Candidatus Krumholzibacteria bacterium]